MKVDAPVARAQIKILRRGAQILLATPLMLETSKSLELVTNSIDSKILEDSNPSNIENLATSSLSTENAHSSPNSNSYSFLASILTCFHKNKVYTMDKKGRRRSFFF
jgi:hypothetical protein